MLLFTTMLLNELDQSTIRLAQYNVGLIVWKPYIDTFSNLAISNAPLLIYALEFLINISALTIPKTLLLCLLIISTSS